MSSAADPGGDAPASGAVGAVFVQNVLAQDSARANAVMFGDQYNYIYRGEPPYRVEPWRTSPRARPVGAGRAPSRLLSAHHGIVPFFPRPEVADVREWRDESATPVRALLLHAEGGAGKTRLADHFARSCAQAGWTVARVRHRSELASAGGGGESLAVRPPGLVLIVDYADRWPVRDLVALVRQHADAARDRVRILLAARSAQRWWQLLAHQFAKNAVDADALRLRPLPADPEVRAAVYRSARDRFAQIYGIDEAGLTDPAAEILADEAYALMLTVHMKALVDVDSAMRGAPPGTIAATAGAAGLSSYLLDRELDHWRSLHDAGAGPSGTDENRMARAVYIGILTGEVDPSTGTEALLRAGVADNGQTAQRVLSDHALCYPAQQADAVLAPLMPDRLAEDYLALTLPGRESEHGYYSTDDWAQSAATALLAPGTDQSTHDDDQPPLPPYAGRVVTVLIESARRWPQVTAAHLEPLLRRRPQLAQLAGSAALSRLAAISELPTDVLAGVEAGLSRSRHVDLDIGAAAVTRRLAEHRLARTEAPSARADVYHNLAAREANAGDYPSALAAISDAVQLRRTAADVDEERIPALVDALIDMSTLLAGTGRPDEALTAAEEAVSLARSFTGPPAGDSRLAAALDSAASRLSDLSRWDESVDPAAEALGLRRHHATQDPDARRDLAASLNNFAGRLIDTRRYDEAVAPAEQAVEIFRGLAGRAPEAHLPDLAVALDQLAGRLSVNHRPEDALAAAEESVRIARALARKNPAAFGPELAAKLSNLSVWLSDAGRAEDALDRLLEAAQLLHSPAPAAPTTTPSSPPALHLPTYTTVLHNLAACLLTLGRPGEALAPARESLRITRRLATAQPAAHLPGLAEALHLLAGCLKALGRTWWELAIRRECVAVLRDSADRDPVNARHYLPAISQGLDAIATALDTLDRGAEALTVRLEQFGLCQQLAEDLPETFLPGLVALGGSLSAQLLQQDGRSGDAVDVARVALDTSRRLAPADPTRYGQSIDVALSRLAEALTASGRRDEALEPLRELARIEQGPSDPIAAATAAAVAGVHGDPSLLQFQYALRNGALADLAVALAEADHHDEAVATAHRLADKCRPNGSIDVALHLPRLVDAFNRLGGRLSRCGQSEAATEVFRASVSLGRLLMDTLPGVALPEIGEAIRRLGAALPDLGADADLGAAVTAYAAFVGASVQTVVASGRSAASAVMHGDQTNVFAAEREQEQERRDGRA